MRQRAALLGQLREFFDSRGFLEVQPPCLARDCVIDAHLDPLAITSDQLRLASCELPAEYYLQTSPESAMKRMLAAGAASLYSLGPVFRGGERGRYHNPEFTMLEWYDVGADMAAGVELLGQLAIEMLGHENFDVRSYRQVFIDALAVDPVTAPLTQLRMLAHEIEPQLTDQLTDDRDLILDLLLAKSLQPEFGAERPLVLTHYPLSQAALAKQSSEDPLCADRFELFVAGIELANGYDELCDPEILLERFRSNNAQRVASGRQPLKVETTLLQAMQRGLPDCTGVALGVDRLLMVQLGLDSIDQVIPLTIDRA